MKQHPRDKDPWYYRIENGIVYIWREGPPSDRLCDQPHSFPVTDPRYRWTGIERAVAETGGSVQNSGEQA